MCFLAIRDAKRIANPRVVHDSNYSDGVLEQKQVGGIRREDAATETRIATKERQLTAQEDQWTAPFERAEKVVGEFGNEANSY